MKIQKLVAMTALLALVTGIHAQMRIHAKSPVGILSSKIVQKELNLTDDQVAMVKQVEKDFRSTISGLMGGGFSGGSVEELQDQVDAVAMRLSKKISDSLTESQKQRHRQLDLQFGPPETILGETYADDLKLTSEQRKQIKTCHQDFLDDMGDLQQAGITDPDELALRRGRARAKALEAIEKLLSADQRETLTKLKGEIVKV